MAIKGSGLRGIGQTELFVYMLRQMVLRGILFFLHWPPLSQTGTVRISSFVGISMRFLVQTRDGGAMGLTRLQRSC